VRALTPRLPTGNTRPRLARLEPRALREASRGAGFILTDVVLALTILLLMAAIVWPMVGHGTSRTQQAATALDIATLLRLDRAAASRNGRLTGTRIDLGERTVIGETGRRVRVPSDLTIEVTTSPQCIEGPQRFLIVFAPDGSSCGGVVKLKKERQIYAIHINWLTGVIDVTNAPNA
jgi:general secretion pathway protein H